MKTVLYIDTKDFSFKTFNMLKDEYEYKTEKDVSDEEMLKIIESNRLFHGGDLCIVDDNVLAWCNDHAEHVEADRYLSRVERDESILNIYLDICSCSYSMLGSLKDTLLEDEEGKLLYKRLMEFYEG